MKKSNNLPALISNIENTKGFTYSINGFKHKRYLVSKYGFEHKTIYNKHNFSNICKKYILLNSEYLENKNTFLGCWMPENSKYVYLDLSNSFNNIKKAIIFGIDNFQLAIFDTLLNRTIYLPTVQRTGTERQKDTYKRLLKQKVENNAFNYKYDLNNNFTLILNK